MPSIPRDSLRICLADQWFFRLDPEDQGKDKQWFQLKSPTPSWQPITVPGCWQAQGFGDKKATATDAEGEFTARKIKAEYTGTGWYLRQVRVPEAWRNKVIRLHIGAVYPSCEIWVNGIPVGSHGDAFIPYQCNITKAVKWGCDNTITIRVFEKNRFLGGKLFYWISNWSGLYRRVTIEAKNEVTLDDAFVMFNRKDSSARVRAEISNLGTAKRNLSVEYHIRFKNKEITRMNQNGIQLDPRACCEITVSIPIRNAHLWSPAEPNLYQLVITLKAEQTVLDQHSSRFGLKVVESKGKALLLNGQRLFLRGYGDDMIYPDTFCPPADVGYYRRIFKIAKAYGFNSVLWYSGASDEFLTAADEVGLLVQHGGYLCNDILRVDGNDQYPLYRLHVNDPIYLAIKNSWQALVKRSRRHPSVLSYIISGETGGNAPGLIVCYNELYDAAKRIDPANLVLSRAGADSFNTLEKTDYTERYSYHPRSSLWRNGSEQEHRNFHDLVCHAHKPCILHEYGWVSSYPDPRTRKDYQGGLRPYWLDIAERKAQEQGLTRALPVFVRNSRKLQQTLRKIALEEARKVPELTGYTLWLFQDTIWAVEGVVDDFYRKKNVSPQEFRQSNGVTTLLINRDSPTGYWGDKVKIDILVSHHGRQKIKEGILYWQLSRYGSHQPLTRGVIRRIRFDAPCNGKPIGHIVPTMPLKHTPEKIRCEIHLAQQGKVIAKNGWDFWFFPKQEFHFAHEVLIYKPHLWLKEWFQAQEQFPNLKGIVQNEWLDGFSDCRLIVSNMVDQPLAHHLKSGGRLLLVSHGLLPELPCEYRTTYWNCSTDRAGTLGTVIAPHPSLGDFPHDGWCDLQFRALFDGAGNLNLDEFPVKIAPIIRVIDGYRWCRNRAHLAEFRVGPGKVLATSFNFSNSLGVLPEANHLFAQLITYATGRDFNPTSRMTSRQFLEMAKAPVRV